MMELFDTHAHFEGDDSAAVLVRAREAGVTRILAVGGSESLNAGALNAFQVVASVLRTDTPVVRPALGYDRDQAGRDLPPIDYAGVVAVGEIGLDYHYAGASRKDQMGLFARQLDLARSLSLPVVIHTREADDDTLGLLREIPSRGVIHCFTGSPQFCKALLSLGFFISISGIVTFRAADNVRESALVVPDDRLLIETDSPFLAPVPNRGKPNEPAFLVHTARFLASLRGVSPDALAARTTANGRALFGL